MKEDLLQYIWKMRLFGKQKLFTSAGEPIEIIKPGEWNKNSGPDFLNARIKIGTTLWAGQIEIHLHSSDFTKHKHHQNDEYKNVILHVVYEDDSGQQLDIPVLELRDVISPMLLKQYQIIFESNQWIPCESLLEKTEVKQLPLFVESLLIEKWESKSKLISSILSSNQNNWEETFYILIVKHFGLPVNAIAFEEIAFHIPLKTLAKCKNNLLQLEAMFFGVAGLLKQNTDDQYYRQLQKEFSFLQKKFSLKEINTAIKFSRMRPVNFAGIRLAQLAALIHQSSHLLSKMLETKSLKNLYQFFDVQASVYWDTHFVFGKNSDSVNKVLGKDMKQTLLINAVIPFLFFYGKAHGNQNLMSQCLDWMDELPSEKNQIIKHWETVGLKCKNAKASQALLYLKKNYCSNKLCLNCKIGHLLLNKNL